MSPLRAQTHRRARPTVVSRMKLTGWGRYPVIESEVKTPITPTALRNLFAGASSVPAIPRGAGRSYGDSALAPNTISSRLLNHITHFDEHTGSIRCGAGVTLAELLDLFVPRGWFLHSTPGTKLISVGGAIASDVHGKSHHREGCFSNHVSELTLMLGNGETVTCSRDTHPELFHATCGGMGLTGVILDASFRLRPIKSAHILETTYKAANLDEALTLIEANEGTTYSVAWIDCLSTGGRLGRSLLMIGDFVDDGRLDLKRGKPLSVPFDMPGCLLNKYTVTAFNALYYHRVRKRQSERIVHFEPFFYPLDSIHDWNRIYGKGGFTQYQFVIPREAGRVGMAAILNRIAESKRGSFLAVLKAFGKGNDNFVK